MPKRYCLRKYNCLDYIKLNGVHGNQSGTVAGSEACPLHLQADLRDSQSLVEFFPITLIQEKQIVSYWRNKMVAK